MFAQTARYWPARPGSYAECDGCEHFSGACSPSLPSRDLPPACLKKTELMMRYQIAFETRDPKMLAQDMAAHHAAIRSIVDNIIMTLVRDGVRLRTPEWHFDKDGRQLQVVDLETGAAILKVEAHPLLKHLVDITQKLGMALPDSGMTQKVQDEQDTVRGFLVDSASQAESIAEVHDQQRQKLDMMLEYIERSNDRKRRDPILIEHASREGDSGG
jgi:hypothetical protein